MIPAFFSNDVIRNLVCAADVHAGKLVQIPMQLENHARARWNEIMAFVNRRQHIAVSGDLFFAAGLGHGLFADELF